jgi:hypothetical protein
MTSKNNGTPRSQATIYPNALFMMTLLHPYLMIDLTRGVN